MNDDVLFHIFSYGLPNITCQLSKYWYQKHLELASYAYNYRLNQLNNLYLIDQVEIINEIDEVKMIHEKFKVGKAEDITLAIDKIYNHKLNQINNNYKNNSTDQVNDIYETIMIHESFHVGKSEDFTSAISEFYKYDYYTIGLCCARNKINKFYEYQHNDNKVIPFKSFIKDRKCICLIILYILVLLSFIALLVYIKIDVRQNTNYYLDKYLGINWVQSPKFNTIIQYNKLTYYFPIGNSFPINVDPNIILLSITSQNLTWPITISILNETLHEATLSHYLSVIYKIYDYQGTFYVAAFTYVAGNCRINQKCDSVSAAISEINYDILILNELISYGIVIGILLLGFICYNICMICRWCHSDIPYID